MCELESHTQTQIQKYSLYFVLLSAVGIKQEGLIFALIAFINNACYEQYVKKSTLAQYESPMSNGKKVCAEFKFSQCRS